MQCPLCQNGSASLKSLNVSDDKKYYDCKICKLIFLDKIFYLSEKEEKKRYLLHNNDINDLGYQQFVYDITNYIQKNIQPPASGLDFGSGSNSVVSSLLKKANFNIYQYDPYFSPNIENLSLKYDFIIACEVVEHLYNPHWEFKKLQYLLNDGAPLVIKTDIYHDSINFDKWYYRGDPTHVVFYRHETFEWIKNTYKFKMLSQISSRSMALWN